MLITSGVNASGINLQKKTGKRVSSSFLSFSLLMDVCRWQKDKTKFVEDNGLDREVRLFRSDGSIESSKYYYSHVHSQRFSGNS